MSVDTDTKINYKVVDYFDLYPTKKNGASKKVKSKYFRKMKELYERGFKLYDFKKSTSFRNDIAILMYNDQTLIGFVFIKEAPEDSEITQGITDPFFYNFVVDPKFQHTGNGTKLFNHVKQRYNNRAIYCLTDSTDKTLHEWYDRRDGIVYNDHTKSWSEGYFVYKFPNGTIHIEPEPSFVQNLQGTDEFQNLKNQTVQAIAATIPDHDPAVGDDLLEELDDICEPDVFKLITNTSPSDKLLCDSPKINCGDCDTDHLKKMIDLDIDRLD